MPISVKITNSNLKNKRLMAIFRLHKGGKVFKITHFGDKRYENYTIHKDKKRKELYLKRHKKNEDWNKYMTAGALSRWILWNKPTLEDSIKDYKERFKLD
tara:strand:+ start:4261 stop:4560 length:300 start_codon:yes stop_codon:yes gene_type:complete